MYIELFFTYIISTWMWIQVICSIATAFVVKKHELHLLPKSNWKNRIIYPFPLLVVKIRKYFNV